jgi:hypothetical protein
VSVSEELEGSLDVDQVADDPAVEDTLDFAIFRVGDIVEDDADWSFMPFDSMLNYLLLELDTVFVFE